MGGDCLTRTNALCIFMGVEVGIDNAQHILEILFL